MLPAWPEKSECQARVVLSRSVGVATSSAMGAVIEPTPALHRIGNRGELVPGGLELRDEFLKLLNLVGDHGALVAVHDRPSEHNDRPRTACVRTHRLTLPLGKGQIPSPPRSMQQRFELAQARCGTICVASHLDLRQGASVRKVYYDRFHRLKRAKRGAVLADRGHWGSRFGFVLAAAGSAVGLGNIWKFPYITGVNGGGAFVLVYLVCVVLVGLPVMIAEILMGRATQKSPVGALKELGGGLWVAFGWLGVAAAFVILSYYSIVAGWALHYTYLSLTGQIAALGPETAGPVFGDLFMSNGLNLFWHVVFMAITVGVVWGGIRKGIERWARILMPTLFAFMVILLVNSFTMEGFSEAQTLYSASTPKI